MTTDYLYELQSAIISALEGDSTLSAIINGVYNHVPADAKYPFIAVDNLSASDITSKTTSGWHIKLAVRVFGSTRSNMEVSGIIAQIRRILDGASLNLSHGNVTSIEEVGSNILRLSDGQTWCGHVGFNIILQQGASTFVASGNDFIIKIGNGASPTETFTTIGGLRNAGISLMNRLVDCSNISAGRWRKLAGSAGIASLRLSGNGFFTDSASEELLRSLAFSGGINNYQILLGNGDIISGAFIVAIYKRLGDVNSEEIVEITLESSGVVMFNAA